MEVKCYRTETYHVHDMRELERLEGKMGNVRVFHFTDFRQGMLKEQSLSYSNIRKLEDMMA